jgi:hypothetical protein
VRYEPPKIVRRERIDAVLGFLVLSGGAPTISDVNRKENIVPVVW